MKTTQTDPDPCLPAGSVKWVGTWLTRLSAGLRAGEMFLRILPRLSEPSGHVTQAEGMQPSLAYRCGGSSG